MDTSRANGDTASALRVFEANTVDGFEEGDLQQWARHASVWQAAREGCAPLLKRLVDADATLANALNTEGESALLDQSLVAGIGNIYADEVLWESKINPLSISNRISSVKINKIGRAHV